MPDHVITASLLIDGDRWIAPIPDAAVAVLAGQIIAVGPSSEVLPLWPDAATVRAFPSGSLLPGFIDAHAHLTMLGDGTGYEDVVGAQLETRIAWASTNAKRHLSVVVTTIRDAGSAQDFLPWGARRASRPASDRRLRPAADPYPRPSLPYRRHLLRPY